MAVVSVRLPDKAYSYAEQFAKFEGVTISEYIRNLIGEKIEDFEDEQTIKEMEEDMIKHPEDYEGGISFEEFAKEFENEKV